MTVNEFRREVLDKLHVYAAANVNPNGVHKAIVQQQCLDHLTDIYRLAVSAFSPQPPTSEESLLADLFERHAKDRSFRDALISLAHCITTTGSICGYADVPARESAARAISAIRKRLGSPQPPTEARLLQLELNSKQARSPGETS